MTDDPVSEAKDIATSLAKDLYKDLVHPAAERTGNALGTIAKIALSPVAILDWGFEETKEWLTGKVRRKLESTPQEFIVAPSPSIVIPVVTHIAMSVDRPSHQELYAELLLKSLDSRTTDQVHPAYVYVIEQISSEEASLILKLHRARSGPVFSAKEKLYYDADHKSIEEQLVDFCREQGIKEPERALLWMDNLVRLRILAISDFSETEFVEEQADRHGSYGPTVKTHRTFYLDFTTFGDEFVSACAPLESEPG